MGLSLSDDSSKTDDNEGDDIDSTAISEYTVVLSQSEREIYDIMLQDENARFMESHENDEDVSIINLLSSIRCDLWIKNTIRVNENKCFE